MDTPIFKGSSDRFPTVLNGVPVEVALYLVEPVVVRYERCSVELHNSEYRLIRLHVLPHLLGVIVGGLMGSGSRNVGTG
jgi:hypothetical protein